MTGLLPGDVAIVTGAARGIGRAIAFGLAAAGDRTIVADLDHAGAQQVAAEIGEAALAADVDVASPESCTALAATAQARFGPVSVLVNNAGVLLGARIDDLDYDARWEATFRVNVDGVRNMIRATLPQLRATAGRIVNVGSSSAVLASGAGSMYAAAKAAVSQQTRALSVDLGPDHIRVNAIAPGNTRSTINVHLPPDHPTWGRYRSPRTPLGSAGEPEDLVGPVVFLASPMSGFVTGAIVPVDGGYTSTGIIL